MGLLADVALEVGADFFFDHAIVAFFFLARVRERVFDDALGAFYQAIVAGVESAGDDFWSSLRLTGQFINSDDGEDDTVFA